MVPTVITPGTLQPLVQNPWNFWNLLERLEPQVGYGKDQDQILRGVKL
jgi:hypothetical protein